MGPFSAVLIVDSVHVVAAIKMEDASLYTVFIVRNDSKVAAVVLLDDYATFVQAGNSVWTRRFLRPHIVGQLPSFQQSERVGDGQVGLG